MTNSPDIVTFGCRLNSLESDRIRQQMSGQATPDDTIIFNTCAVTAEAERQARQAIRRARRDKPGAKIIVTGCAAQISPDTYATMDEVDQVLGNEEKLDITRFLNAPEPVAVQDIMDVTETTPHLADGFSDRARAFLQVQNGCDHRCTFCIIPYGRGNSRSVPVGSVVEQARLLVDQGFSEIVITGVDITSYGADLPGASSAAGGMSLGKLCQKILTHVPDLPRLRLSSIDSIEVDEPLMDLIVGEPRFMPHLHLSLQAGDNMILKRMKRRHLREESIAFCQTVKQQRPDIAFGADLIAGFPTETEEMFQNSLNLVEECALTFLHVFPYSPRPGTPAARMPQLDRSVIKDRAARLRQLGQDKLTTHLSQQVGTRISALVEKPGLARAQDFTEVIVDEGLQPGSIHALTVTDKTDKKLIAL